MPEWSKGCDSSSHGVSLGGSNPPQHKFIIIILYFCYNII